MFKKRGDCHDSLKNMIEKDYLLKELDGLILSGKAMPYRMEMIIENKEPEEFKKENIRNKVRRQVAEYCYAVDCRLSCITDGKLYYFYLVNSHEEVFMQEHEFNGVKVTSNPTKYENNNVIKLNDIKTGKESQFLLAEILISIDVFSSILKIRKNHC